MASRVALALHQGNDEVVDLTITPVSSSDDLSVVTRLSVYLKPSVCVADSDASVVTLTTLVPSQVLITTQTAVLIEATVWIDASHLAEPYDRVWRVDAHVGTSVRTAMYGPVTIVDL